MLEMDAQQAANRKTSETGLNRLSFLICMYVFMFLLLLNYVQYYSDGYVQLVCTRMLKLELLEWSDLDPIMSQFAALDVDKSGVLTEEDLLHGAQDIQEKAKQDALLIKVHQNVYDETTRMETVTEAEKKKGLKFVSVSKLPPVASAESKREEHV